MNTHNTIIQLKIASGIVIAFGLLTALAAWPALNLPTLWLVDLMFWPFDSQQNLHGTEARVLCGILGGVLAGWGALLWLITTKLYAREPALARGLILTSMWTWFIVDCAASVIAGAAFNGVMNLGFLLLFVVPLWRTTQYTQTA